MSGGYGAIGLQLLSCTLLLLDCGICVLTSVDRQMREHGGSSLGSCSFFSPDSERGQPQKRDISSYPSNVYSYYILNNVTVLSVTSYEISMNKISSNELIKISLIFQ